MARTQITVQEVTSADIITADGPDTFTFADMDAANGNYFNSTGREVILVRNTSADTNRDLTIQGQAVNRVEADVVHAIAFGTFAAYFLNPRRFRVASTGRVELDAAHADIEIAVIRLPRV